MRIPLTRRRVAAVDAALPDVLEHVAAGLRAGSSPLTALRDAAGGADLPEALSTELVRVVERAEQEGLESALAAWVDPCPSRGPTEPGPGDQFSQPGAGPAPGAAATGAFRRSGGGNLAPLRAVAAALQVAAGAGGPAAPALDGLATGLRDGHDAAGEVAALSAQARLSAIVVGAAPFVSLTLSLAVDRRVAPALVGTPSGRTCLLVGLSAELLAALWMRRIVRGRP